MRARQARAGRGGHAGSGAGGRAAGATPAPLTPGSGACRDAGIGGPRPAPAMAANTNVEPIFSCSGGRPAREGDRRTRIGAAAA